MNGNVKRFICEGLCFFCFFLRLGKEWEREIEIWVKDEMIVGVEIFLNIVRKGIIDFIVRRS